MDVLAGTSQERRKRAFVNNGNYCGGCHFLSSN
jgi:hypothetical protein